MMGDRTSVYLTVSTAHKDAVSLIGEAAGWPCENGDEFNTHIPQLAGFSYSEVNYGDLEFLPELRAAGIAYESNWENGDEYTAGTEYCRFTERGEIQIINLHDCDINPQLHMLTPLLDTPDQLVAAIKHHVERTTPLSWLNQEEYGRLYRVTQLITPRE